MSSRARWKSKVKLRDERVIVERRPASGTVGSDVGAMQERVFEVTERHEEPVVEKRAREAEEVVVRKEADERVETVPFLAGALGRIRFSPAARHINASGF
jgi:stress response protein YsnF